MKKNIYALIIMVFFSSFPFLVWGTDMGTIESGEVHTGTLSLPDYTDTWQFTGDTGDRVVITTSRSGSNVQPEIYLYPPGGGSVEASETGLSYSNTLDHQLLQTGLYTIIIKDYNMDNLGDYGIALAKIPGDATSVIDPDGGVIASGETLSGTMDVRADSDIFQFSGDTGDRVVITTFGSNVQPEIYLYPPDSGPKEASETGLSYSNTLDHQLLQTGLYTIIIKDYNMDNIGGYEISLIKTPNTVPTLSEWGMIIFFIILVGSALLVLRRRTRQNPS